MRCRASFSARASIAANRSGWRLNCRTAALRKVCPRGVDVFIDNTAGVIHEAVMQNLAPNAREPLTLVMGGRERCNPDYVITRRGFPFHVLEYVVSGYGAVQLDDRAHALGPGMIFAYAPTTSCEIHTDPRDTLVKYFLCVAGARVPPRLKRCGLALGTARQLAAHAEITSVVEDLVREGQRSGPLVARIA